MPNEPGRLTTICFSLVFACLVPIAGCGQEEARFCEAGFLLEDSQCDCDDGRFGYHRCNVDGTGPGLCDCACQPFAESRCEGDRLTWFDSCGNRQQTPELCACPCGEGQATCGEFADPFLDEMPAATCTDMSHCLESRLGACTPGESGFEKLLTQHNTCDQEIRCWYRHHEARHTEDFGWRTFQVVLRFVVEPHHAAANRGLLAFPDLTSCEQDRGFQMLEENWVCALADEPQTCFPEETDIQCKAP